MVYETSCHKTNALNRPYKKVCELLTGNGYTLRMENIMSKFKAEDAKACIAEGRAMCKKVREYYKEATYDEKRSLALLSDKAAEHDKEAIQELSELFSIEYEPNTLVAALTIQSEAYGKLEVLTDTSYRIKQLRKVPPPDQPKANRGDVSQSAVTFQYKMGDFIYSVTINRQTEVTVFKA